MINAVMLGAIAGCGKLPIPVGSLRGGDPRRRQGGRKPICAASVPGSTAARDQATAAPARADDKRRASRATDLAVAGAARSRPHAGSRRSDDAIEGVRRLVAYPGLRLCAALSRSSRGDARRSMRTPAATASLLRETARHLAVRMSYEDVIRVAQAKIDPARMQRIAKELRRQAAASPIASIEFLKPGIEEMCSGAAAVAGAPHHRLLAKSAAGSIASISAWR